MNYEKINSIDELKKLSGNGVVVECFVSLGCARSSKTISYNEGAVKQVWWVCHEVDGSEEYFQTDEELLSNSVIGEAIKKECFYRYIY